MKEMKAKGNSGEMSAVPAMACPVDKDAGLLRMPVDKAEDIPGPNMGFPDIDTI